MEIRDKTFVGETIQMDGKSFLNCSFQNCILKYAGGQCEWENTDFRDCQVVLEGAASRTVHIIAGLGGTVNVDGQQASPRLKN